MTDHQSKHVFISYVRENQDQVDRLCQDLESQGVNIWLDRHSIKPGARWKDAIREAIRHGDFFIACFSDEYTSKTKSYMNEELTLATEELRQYASDREWFIPVLLSECGVPARSIGAGETLLDINWVPLYENWDAGIQKILSVIKPIPPEIQNLMTALRAKDPNVRSNAIGALGRVGNPLVVPILIDILRNKDDKTDFRLSAAAALRKIGSEENTIVPALVEALKDKDEKVRRTAAYALMKIGPKAKGAIPALVEALKDKDEKTHHIATEALANIGLEAVPALIETLKDKDQNVRALAGRALDKTGQEAVPALINALKGDKSVRDWALAILENIKTSEAQQALENYRKKSK